ncbi:hypothetical protein LCGC14_2766520 [marine sediment metagenome]|uniref:Clp R domain-containing protein n=1 Tax=marine sediment metagenome TaxID=412755 RepID=A0A0F8ZJ83_9ZZZZ
MSFNKKTEALQAALQFAEALESDYLGTEHVLMGLLSQKQGRAAEILSQFGDIDTIRAKVLSAIYG